VSAVLSHSGGMQGTVHFSTLQSPAQDVIEIVCDRGTVVVESQSLVRVTNLAGSIRELTVSETRSMPDVASQTYERVFPRLDMESMLQEFYRNFANAAHKGSPLLAHGVEGRGSIELANAMILSSEMQARVALPVDRDAYDMFIEKKCRISREEATRTLDS